MNIRNIVICLIENNGKIFVGEGYDEIKDETYYRPLGGGIDFGEKSEDTAIREFREEMDTEIEVISYLHTFENIFTLNGKAGHQIVLMYSAKFKDKSLYDLEEVTCDENGLKFVAKWVHKDEFLAGEKILYPDGLPNFLQKHINNH